MASKPVNPYAIVPELLSYKNYEQWSLRVKTYLMAENLWDFVKPSTDEAGPQPKPEDNDGEEYKDWTRNNAKALYVIQNSCGSDMLSVITKTFTAKDAWEALEIDCKAKQKAEKDERYIPFADLMISGDWEKAEEYLKKQPKAKHMRDTRRGYGDTAVHLAARNNQLQTVKWLMLVMTKEDIQSKNNNGSTALHMAVKYGFLEIVKVLMPLMGQVKHFSGDTALHLAVRQEHVNIVKELKLLMTQEDLRLKNDDGFTALHLAAKLGYLNIMKELVPVMGEIKSCDGDTALHVAAMKSNARIVKELVKLMKREDLEIRNNNGDTALDLAVKAEDVPIVKELVSYDDQFDRYIPFTDFVSKGEWENAKECLEELNSYVHDAIRARDPRDECGNSALHVAAKLGHVDIVKELVLLMRLKSVEEKKTDGTCEETSIEKAKYLIEQKEYDLEQRNASGETALHLAVSKGNVHVVKELVKFMSKEGFEVKDEAGFTALHRAVMDGNADIVKELVKFMSKEGFEVKDEAGFTALHRAVMDGNADIVKELVSCMRQEGLNLKDANGSHALHRAVKAEKVHISIVKELVSAMSPEALEIKDSNCCTTLGCALEKRQPDEDVKEIAKCMAEKNANVFAIEMPNGYGLPVVWACIYGKVELGRYLYSLTPAEAFDGMSGSYLISVCIKRMNNLDIALHLLQLYPRLALQGDAEGDYCPMLVLARMHYAFLSGTRLTLWQKWIYNTISVQPPAEFNIRDVYIDVSKTHDYPGKLDEAFIFSVASLFTSCVEILRKHLGIDHVYKMKAVHLQVRKFLDCFGKVRDTPNLPKAESNRAKESTFKAIEKGHFEFVMHLLEKQVFEISNEDNKGIFHLAVEHRQENIYNLIYRLNKEGRYRVGRNVARGTNYILHAAGKLSPAARTRLDHIQGASLQMQREMQWFKEVESIVPLDVHEAINRTDRVTGRELFTKNHKELMEEAEKSIKETASSCTVVGSLIATMMFAAAFTVPGGNNNNTGIPMLIDNDFFLAFIVSDTLSLVSSTTSVIIFLGLLTSRYSEDDYLTSLPKKMMTGLFTLFLSIATMMVAFSYALVIMLHEKYSWIVTPAMILASVPIASFVWVQFPLLVTTFISTYGPGIFEKDSPRPWSKTLMEVVVSRFGFSTILPRESIHEDERDL